MESSRAFKPQPNPHRRKHALPTSPSAAKIRVEKDRLDAQVAEVNRRLKAAYRTVEVERRSQSAASDKLLKCLEAVEKRYAEEDKLVEAGTQSLLVWSAELRWCAKLWTDLNPLFWKKTREVRMAIDFD